MTRKSKRSSVLQVTMEQHTSHSTDIETDGHQTQCENRVVRSTLHPSLVKEKVNDKEREDSAFSSTFSEDYFLSGENAHNKFGNLRSEQADTTVASGSENASNIEPHIDNLHSEAAEHSDLDDSDDEGICLNTISGELQNLEISDDENESKMADKRLISRFKCENVNDRITPMALLIYGKDMDGDTYLHIAIIQCCIEFALRFIGAAPWYDWLDIYNDDLRQTPLHLAVLTRLKVVVRRLMVGGANVEMRDHNGDTPLHIACRKGYLEIVKTLLEPVTYEETQINDYDVPFQCIPQNLNTRNYDGLTCLHVAAQHNHTDILLHLIGKGADVNVGDGRSGKTVLHLAAERNNIKLIKTLLAHKSVLVDAKTYNGSTPLLIAHERKYTATFDLLVGAGASISCLEEPEASDSDDDYPLE